MQGITRVYKGVQGFTGDYDGIHGFTGEYKEYQVFSSISKTFSFSFFNSARNVAISFVREATDSDSDLLLASRDSILD